MKKVLFILLLIFVPLTAHATIICNDGTPSPTCGDCHRGCCSRHGGCSSSYSESSNNNSNINSSSNNNYNSDNNRHEEVIERKSSDANIKSIIVNENEIKTISNIIYLDVNSNKVDIKVNLSDSRATYSIEGDSNLKTDTTNVFKINVTAEDGTSKIYYLKITRKTLKSTERLFFYLNNKKVKFNNNDYYYTSKRFKDNKISFRYETSSELNTIKVYKNNKIIKGKTIKLKKGMNKIKIILTDKEGNQRTYKINIQTNK